MGWVRLGWLVHLWVDGLVIWYTRVYPHWCVWILRGGWDGILDWVPENRLSIFIPTTYFWLRLLSTLLYGDRTFLRNERCGPETRIMLRMSDTARVRCLLPNARILLLLWYP